MEVRTPWPISERWFVTVTVPSGAIAMNTFGSSRQPCGMPSAPYLCSFCSWVWVSSALGRGAQRQGEHEGARAPEDAPAADIGERRTGRGFFGGLFGHQLEIVNHRRSPFGAAVWPAA